jgi:hypothetical protein
MLKHSLINMLKADDILEQPYLNPDKKSIRNVLYQMVMQRLIHSFMPLSTKHFVQRYSLFLR